MVFDVEQHEENKLKFLAVLYSIAQERIGCHPNAGDPTLIDELEAEIGKRAGLTRQQAERVNAELQHEGMTQFVDAVGPDGPNTCLTREGLSSIERHLNEQSKRGAGRPDDRSEQDVSYDQAKAASREFQELTSDLMHSDSNTFADHFNLLYEFIENDATMHVVTADVRDHPGVDIDKWLADFEASGGSMIGSHSYVLPHDKAQQAATILQLYGKIYDNKVDVRAEIRS